jgi:phage-related protein
MAVKFYTTAAGRQPARDFLGSLSLEVREDFLNYVSKLESGETLGMPISRNMSGVYKGLKELRLNDVRGTYRIFYFFFGGDFHVLLGFQKKTNKTPFRELQIAINRAKEVKNAI